MVTHTTLGSVSESDLLGQILPLFGRSPYAGAGVLVPPGDDLHHVLVHHHRGGRHPGPDVADVGEVEVARGQREHAVVAVGRRRALAAAGLAAR